MEPETRLFRTARSRLPPAQSAARFAVAAPRAILSLWTHRSGKRSPHIPDAIESKEELLAQLRAHADELVAFDGVSIALFGSIVREEARPDSDVDLLVEFAPGEKSFDKFMELNFFLEDLLGRSVELLTPESLDDAFAEAIEDEFEYVDGTEHVSPPHPR